MWNAAKKGSLQKGEDIKGIFTHHTILNRKSQLVLCVWPLDFNLNNRGAGHSRQFHSRLIFGILQ